MVSGVSGSTYRVTTVPGIRPQIDKATEAVPGKARWGAPIDSIRTAR